MKKEMILNIAVLVALIATVIFVFVGFSEPAPAATIYWCPMHPFYKVKRYGICPYCSMELQVYKGEVGEAEPVLVLTDQQIQQAGVRTEKAGRRRLVREILTSGILEKNRERYWHIDTRFEGWVEELYINQEGEAVKAGQPLAKIYSPQLYATQNEYLLVRSDPEMAKAARRRLELMRIDEQEIKALEERGTPTDRLTLRSPYDGIVVHRNVKPGMKLPEDGHIADIADLRELWLFADIYDREIGLVQVGRTARLVVASYPNDTFEGRIDLIEPMVRPETQTARVRIRVKNDPVRLLPGQFARVMLLNETEPVLAVSEHAVIPTGRRDIVIVARGGGTFAAREVTIGRRGLTEIDPARVTRGLPFFTGHARYHEVIDGLQEGEGVVTSGAFLLHAETQIRQLIDKMVPPKTDEPKRVRSAWSGALLDRPVAVGEHAFAGHDEHAKFSASPESSWNRRFPKVEEAFGKVMEQYFLIHGAVVKGDWKLATEYGEALTALLEDVRAPISDAFAGEEAERIRAIADRIKSNALWEALPPRGCRARFGELSAAVEAWIAAYGPPIQKVSQFYCGMAQKSVGSPTERWFQPDEELRNPFGMEGCGSLEKVLQRSPGQE